MSMRQLLTDIRAEVEAGWVQEKKHGNLSLFNYTRACQLDCHWNKTTLMCRGLCINTDTIKIVARPFKKFFNLNENHWGSVSNFPVWTDSEPVEVTDKMDGSLGIIVKMESEPDGFLVCTKSSFTSRQSIWAHQYIVDNWNISELAPGTTYLVEIIYPDNRIVVNYKGREDLVLLAMIDNISGQEYLHNSIIRIASTLNASYVPIQKYDSFDQILVDKMKADFNTEGWIVHFVRTGQRVKIKTEDYLRLHRIVSNLSPLAMWETMKDGKVDQKYMDHIPEEFKPEVTSIKENLEDHYADIKRRISDNYLTIITETGLTKKFHTDKDIKRTAIMIQKVKDPLLKSGAFALMRDQSLDKIIMRAIRPTSNELKEQ